MRINIKKIISAALVIALTTTLSGCFFTDIVDDVQGELFENIKFEDDSEYTIVERAKSVNCEYYEPVDITYGYDSLMTETQKSCYNSIDAAVYRISEVTNDIGLYSVGKVTVEDIDFTENDMDVCIKAYTMDHPEVFWITNRYSYGSSGNKTVIQLYSNISGEECKERITTLNNKIESIVTNIPNGLKEYHLEKYIHNTITEMCEYADGVENTDDGWEEFTVYGALVNGSSVCEGYAHAMCLLLNKVGLECYYVNGYGENEPHMWNSVQVDGNWYHVDATWNDDENAYYNYFNLTDLQIQSDHVIAEKWTAEEDKPSLVYNIYLPDCDSESANYYVVESTYIYDFEECAETMVYDLEQAAINKDKEFTIRFDSSYGFENAMDKMFNEDPYYMFDYIRQANDRLTTDYKINEENVSIIILENFNSVVVKLEYV